MCIPSERVGFDIHSQRTSHTIVPPLRNGVSRYPRMQCTHVPLVPGQQYTTKKDMLTKRDPKLMRPPTNALHSMPI